MDKSINKIIWDIMNAGGVVIVDNFAAGYKLKYDTAYRKLEELYQDRLLTKREYFIKPANKAVYQVTQKATKLFNRKDSNLRKKHNDLAMRRYLTKSDVYFTLLSRNQNLFVSDFEGSKIKVLIESCFREENLPKRIYKAKNGELSNTIYFDDMILDVKSNEIKTIAIDDYRITQEVFLKNLMKKYKEMLKNSSSTAYVDIVTDSKLRAAIFKNIFDLKYKDSTKDIKLEFKYLSRSYEKSD